ncbi:hypothetical protein TNIN_172451 [Trichonephila inaurata madagascariensis]|uniref:Uncharacterized protein n=1 Tax=Trichonephila inaurata madagascariensis TaxID=2747483 RepID=A0A8X6XQR5_9ARAC|nr:hypothetical protein TNIN_172451 [Trichonephila inaurata madagascariensis]
MEDHVYESSVDREIELVVRIVATTGIAHVTPFIFENVQWSVQQRYESCIRLDGKLLDWRIPGKCLLRNAVCVYSKFWWKYNNSLGMFLMVWTGNLDPNPW